MEPTSTNKGNVASRSEMHRLTMPSLPFLRAPDRKLESLNDAAAVANAVTTTVQPPLPQRKKQKVHHKPAPIERDQLLSEDSKSATVHGASEIQSETRLSQQTGAPRQIPFIFSHPIPISNFVAPETRLPRSDNVLNQLLCPIEYNESSIFTGPQQYTLRDSVSQLVASLPSPSIPLQSASMAAPRPMGATNYWLRVGQANASPSSSIHPDLLTSQLAQGFHAFDALSAPDAHSISSSTNNLSFRDNHLTLAPSQSTFTDTQTQFHRSRTATQILEDMLRVPQAPQNPVVDVLPPIEREATAVMERPMQPVLPTRSSILLCMPAIMGHSSCDNLLMNAHQVYLRQQIEIFEATEDDLYVNNRGRNKKIHIGQVGIRCRHCTHVPVRVRQPGSMYFPATMSGLYQAAQNMSTNHIQCGLCTEMPESVKTRFVELWPTRNKASRVGRRYWEESARLLGLVDTENGIAFQPNPGTTP